MLIPGHAISTCSLSHFRLGESEDDDSDDEEYGLERGAAEADSARAQVVRNRVITKRRDSAAEPIAGAGSFPSSQYSESACEKVVAAKELVEEEDGGAVVLLESKAEDETAEWQNEDGELDEWTGAVSVDGSGAARGGGDSAIRAPEASLKPEVAAVPASFARVEHAASCDGALDGAVPHGRADSSGWVATTSAEQLQGPWRRRAQIPSPVSSTAMDPLAMPPLPQSCKPWKSAGLPAVSPTPNALLSQVDAYCDDSDDNGVADAASCDAPPDPSVSTSAAEDAAQAESPKTTPFCSAIASAAPPRSCTAPSMEPVPSSSESVGTDELGFKLASSAAAASALAARMRARRDALSAKLLLVNRISAQLQVAMQQRDPAAARALQARLEATAAAETSLAAAAAASAAGGREVARRIAEADAIRLAAEESRLAEAAATEAVEARHAAKASASASAAAEGCAAVMQQAADEAAARVLALEAALAELTAEETV